MSSFKFQKYYNFLLLRYMGNTCCGAEVRFTHFIEQNDYQSSKDILSQNLGQRGLDFIAEDKLPLWRMKNGDKFYCGKFNNGRAEGIALVFVPGHFYYEGSFKNGLPQGHGYLKLINQTQFYQEYEGNFEQGMAHGKGKLSSSSKDNCFYFDGQWENSEAVKGRLRLLSPSQVEYIDFSKSGNFIQFKKGDTYEGDLNCYFEPDGLGTFTYNNECSTEKYVGEWFRGKFNGDGVCTWRDGSSYAGSYSNGEKQGQGKYIFTSRNYYEGHWLQGKEHGIGTLFHSNGTPIKKGVWVKGKLEIQLNEDEFKGFLHQNLPVIQENQLKNSKTLTKPHQ